MNFARCGGARYDHVGVRRQSDPIESCGVTLVRLVTSPRTTHGTGEAVQRLWNSGVGLHPAQNGRVCQSNATLIIHRHQVAKLSGNSIPGRTNSTISWSKRRPLKPETESSTRLRMSTPGPNRFFFFTWGRSAGRRELMPLPNVRPKRKAEVEIAGEIGMLLAPEIY